jgi:hypothetical protein
MKPLIEDNYGSMILENTTIMPLRGSRGYGGRD